MYIKDEDIQLVVEKTHRDPVIEDLDEKTELFSKLYKLDILVSLKNSKNEIILSDHGISKKFKFKLEIFSNKAISLGSYLYIINNLINLEDSATLIDKNFSGTVFEALLNDKNDQFFRLLITQLQRSFREGDSPTDNIERVISLFTKIAKKDYYINNFSKLGYWKLTDFDHEQVVELLYKWEQIELLLLYFRDQELTIAVALKNHDFTLSLEDKRIQNFLHAVMRNNNLA
ncbi:MAG: hypothetical protein H0U27_11210 [Nitrosopumilus sp.]|nr:hypothetical protein [Nitrosopumilus sp.]